MTLRGRKFQVKVNTYKFQEITQKKSMHCPDYFNTACLCFLLWQFSTPKGNNVVLIVSDSLRKDVLDCYGGEARTPNVNWLATNGVLFENAYTTSPWTIPSSVSLFTGNYPTSYNSVPIRQWYIPIISDEEILPAELLRQIGYDVKIDTEHSLNECITQGFEKIKTYDELTNSEKVYIQRYHTHKGRGCIVTNKCTAY